MCVSKHRWWLAAFGIAPKSLKILGQEVTDSTQQEIAKAITGSEPAVDVKIHYVDVPNRPGYKVIAMHFDGWVWGERPHTFHGCPYYKVESTTKVMQHEMYDERIMAHQPQIYAWERQIVNTQPVPNQFYTSTLPVKALIEKATDDFMTVWQLAELCELKDIRYFRKNYLNPALEEGAIERLYPEQPQHPKQKYRLTEDLQFQ